MNKHIANLRVKVGKHKTLIQNFSYLSALQVFNMLLPLITYPYLIRVLGKETYGLVVFAQAIIGYLVILVSFGFNISATKEISKHRDNKEKLHEIFSSILIIKAILLGLTIIILVLLLLIIPQAKGYETLFLLTLWMCLYDIIFPLWYFQGIEQMKYITFITLVSRIIFLGLIFILIHNPNDYLFVPIINGIGAFLGGFISLYIIFFKHNIKFVFQPYSILKHYFIDSVPIFISNVSIRIYINTNKVIVGLFLGMSEVAFYDLAEKIVNLFKVPQTIITQTLFPKISKDKNIQFVKSTLKYSLILNISLFLIILLFRDPIILLLGGNKMLDASPIVLLLAITIPIVGLSNMYGIQILIAFGFNKEFSKSVIYSGVIFGFQILLLWLFNLISLFSIAIVNIVVELSGFLIMYSYSKKRNII